MSCVAAELNAPVNLEIPFQEFACRCHRNLHGITRLQVHLKNRELEFPRKNPVVQIRCELRVRRKHETPNDPVHTPGSRRKLKLRIVKPNIAAFEITNRGIVAWLKLAGDDSGEPSIVWIFHSPPEQGGLF